MADFTQLERESGVCRCGQTLWAMPMMDCPAKDHHDPAFLPINKNSPFHWMWLAGRGDTK